MSSELYTDHLRNLQAKVASAPWWTQPGKVAAVPGDQLAPPDAAAEQQAAAGPPTMDPAMAAQQGMVPVDAATGQPVAAPAGGAPAQAPAGDPAAAAAAGGQPPMDPAMAGPAPSMEEMAQQGDPIATFLLNLDSKIDKLQEGLKAMLTAMNAQVPAASVLDSGSQPKISLPQPEAAGKSESGKTAAVPGVSMASAARQLDEDDDDFDDTDLGEIDDTQDDESDLDKDVLKGHGLVALPNRKRAEAPDRDPLLPKAAASPRESFESLGSRAGTPGDGGAIHQPTGLANMSPRNTSHVRMLRLRKATERNMNTGQFSKSPGDRYRA